MVGEEKGKSKEEARYNFLVSSRSGKGGKKQEKKGGEEQLLNFLRNPDEKGREGREKKKGSNVIIRKKGKNSRSHIRPEGESKGGEGERRKEERGRVV